MARRSLQELTRLAYSDNDEPVEKQYNASWRCAWLEGEQYEMRMVVEVLELVPKSDLGAPPAHAQLAGGRKPGAASTVKLTWLVSDCFAKDEG